MQRPVKVQVADQLGKQFDVFNLTFRNRAGLLCATLIAIVGSDRAAAQFSGQVAATGQFESDSNIFALNRDSPPPRGLDTTRRSDTFYAYGAQADAIYKWSRQQFHLSATGTQYQYQNFTELNHYSYALDAGAILRFSQALDGKIDVVRTRTMVPFFNLTGSTIVQNPLALSLSTDQKETGLLGLALTTKWRLEATAAADKTDQPVLGAPNLKLYQNMAGGALDYLGINGFTSGISGSYMEGEYLGSLAFAALGSRFSQTTTNVLAKYKSGRSSLDANIGYSQRSSSYLNDNASGLTGLFDFTDQVTARTKVSVKVDREIQNYVLNSSSEIATGIGGSVTYQATYKSAFSAGYTFTYATFPHQGNNPIGSDRVDIQESVNFDISYQPFRWLLIKPYANVQTRRSTFIGGHYSASIYGIYVTVSTPEPRK